MSQTIKRRRRLHRQTGFIDPELLPLNDDEQIAIPQSISTTNDNNFISPQPVLTLGSQQQQQLQRSKPRRIVTSSPHITMIERLARAEQHSINGNQPSTTTLQGSLLDLQAYQMVPDALEAKLSAATSINSLLSSGQRTSSIEIQHEGTTLVAVNQDSSTSPSSTSPFITVREKSPAASEIDMDSLNDGWDITGTQSIHETTPEPNHHDMDGSDEIDMATSYHEASPTNLNQANIDTSYQHNITETYREASPTDLSQANYENTTTETYHEVTPSNLSLANIDTYQDSITESYLKASPTDLSQANVDTNHQNIITETDPKMSPANVNLMDVDTGTFTLPSNEILPTMKTTSSTRQRKTAWIVNGLDETVSSLGPLYTKSIPKKKRVRLSKRDSCRIPKRNILPKKHSDWNITPLYPS